MQFHANRGLILACQHLLFIPLYNAVLLFVASWCGCMHDLLGGIAVDSGAFSSGLQAA